MRLLLDTHVFLWTLASPDQLTAQAREAIVDGSNEVLVSGAVAWEIAIKRAIGKLVFDGRASTESARLGFTPLPVTIEHAERLEQLPNLHKDPFDRILVAQALEEQATLVTRDDRVRAYPVATLAG